MDPIPSTEPRPIKRLSETLINKIAAGEIIQRPASALKELLENSLDAGATSIKITVRDGGLKLLQIQDNGCGIRRADLPILAERFTTSKLSTFSDLSRISTYGFRGEALASISHVARLSVITKTKADSHAWRASYVDGVLVDSKTGQPSDPRPCAGNDGTVITIEDLFYNTSIRLAALRSASEEYSRILDVVTRYAIHNPKVSFFCKKAESSAADVSTPSSSDVAQAIRLLYGGSIAKELLHSQISSSSVSSTRVDEDAMDEDEDDDVLKDLPNEWRAEAYFTNPNYQAKKTVFLLFINHRLVDSPRIKRALEAVYQGILPKGSSPFIYLSLELDPRSVDVNVHPTKREVHFLNEEVITQKVADSIQSTLAQQGQSRRFEYQTLLTGGLAESLGSNKRTRSQRDDDDDEDDHMDTGEGPSTGDPKKKIYPQHKIRTSLHDRTLDSMIPVINSSQVAKSPSKTDDGQPPSTQRSKEIKESKCFLTSVKGLRDRIVQGKHRQLTEILEQHTFVGIVDNPRCLSLIQHQTKLYLINHGALAEEMFYQLGLRQFGDFKRIKLKPAPLVRDLIKIAVDVEDSLDEQTSLTKDEATEKITNILRERREMLSEYFSLDISSDGKLESIPLLLRDYTPNLDNLPGFLMRLGPQVNWHQETECFDTFLRELAYFYVPISSPPLDPDSQAESDLRKSDAWQLEHVLFPAFRKYLAAPKALLDRDIVQVANLPDLYKIFERC